LDELTRQEQGASQPPIWHPLALIALIVSVAATGILLQRGLVPAPVPAGSRILDVYLPLLLVQWSLFFYVTRVAQPPGTTWVLVGERWRTVRRALGDIGLAIGFACVIALAHGLLARESGEVSALLPITPAERVAWILVACSVGICEEVVFRGYLQSWLRWLTSSASLGVVLQALLFGLAHAEQGLSGVALAALYAVGFGSLAYARNSLIPGILAHIGVDLCAGWFPDP
jgi:uncharacterized protein